ncbi:hypothetical protein HOY80DRAFT_990209 [Tuber brumale]|nr:hypothetical protein HOY80DRAFT_990209 [Tuber brumale]
MGNNIKIWGYFLIFVGCSSGCDYTFPVFHFIHGVSRRGWLMSDGICVYVEDLICLNSFKTLCGRRRYEAFMSLVTMDAQWWYFLMTFLCWLMATLRSLTRYVWYLIASMGGCRTVLEERKGRNVLLKSKRNGRKTSKEGMMSRIVA